MIPERTSKFKLSIIGHTIVKPEAPDLRNSFRAALNALKITEMKPFQTQVYSAGLKPGARLLCAAETGAGKTLAYLLPIIEKLKREEEDADRLCRQRNAPRALVLLPSAELVNQVGQVTKALSHHVKMRVMHLSKASSPARIKETLSSGPVDILITTPHQALQAADEGRISFDSLMHLVVDEADSMLDDADTFGPQIKRLLDGTPTSLSTTIEGQLDTLPPRGGGCPWPWNRSRRRWAWRWRRGRAHPCPSA